MAKTEDFRLAFSKMAPQAIISRSELASLLSTTDGAISQMAYRGELPATAFPTKRRACWFVSDIRRWLDTIAEGRTVDSANSPGVSAIPRSGRPRLSVEKLA
jgi:hypothetical protein